MGTAKPDHIHIFLSCVICSLHKIESSIHGDYYFLKRLEQFIIYGELDVSPPIEISYQHMK